MKQRNIIFHLPKHISYDNSSASQIRPIKMLNAFKKLGFNVYTVVGRAKQRKRAITVIKKQIYKGIKYDFMYSESSTMPTLLTEPHHLPTYPFLDFNFFKFLKKNNVKIGLFYRDIYWNFDKLYDISSVKKYYAKIFYYWDLYNYNKLIDILYLPSLKMNDYIPYDLNITKKELPPGLDEIIDSDILINKGKLNIFYVGGIGTAYNFIKLFKVVSSLDFVNLTVCTREKDWHKVQKDYQKYLTQNIKIIHKSGKDLLYYYKEADILSLFFEDIIYRTFAMPYKLFEYLSMQKPIIAVNNTAAGEFVRNNDIGWAIDYNEKQLERLLIKLKDNPELLREKKKNMYNVAKNNFWINRAKTVINDLS